ncbi:hypothetical protein [Sphaerisporangium album]|uniref:hypothetical protein n=1 Tax=Sphaerisporangium album TaxID=509200 RepID=UPI0015F0AC90|nr:hypothetical protein [Sphaerisporangium album]
MSDAKQTQQTARGQQWPAGANSGPTRPLHTCSCGAVSSDPINHDHDRKGGRR